MRQIVSDLTLQRKHLYWVCGISVLVALLAVWTFAIEWEWSHFGDDAGLVQTVRESVQEGNVLTPFLQTPLWAWSEATNWGLFRPAVMVYTAFTYQLPPNLAHLVRLVMYGLALATPIVLFLRNSNRIWILWPIVWLTSLGLANYSMLYGVYLVSLSELTAIFLVSIALLVPNRWLQVTLLVAGALAKAPFIWLALFYAAYLALNKRTRGAGIFGITLALVSLAVITYASQVGSYTNALVFNPWHFLKNLEQLGSYGIIFFIILVVGLLIFAPILNPRPLTYILLASAVFFAANLLPWNTIGYYNAPIWFLITCAMATALRPENLKKVNLRWTSKAILTLSLLGSALLCAETLRTDVLGRNTMAVESRDWILENLGDDQTYLLYNIWPHEFQFYLTEQNPTWTRQPPVKWFAGEDRPAETLEADYAVVSNEVSVTPELTRCPPIKVWTRAYLAPVKC